MRLAIVPGGQLELVADRPVALVAGEEAVEDLLAVLGRAPASASRTSNASSSSPSDVVRGRLRDLVVGSLARARAASRSRQSRRVSWAIQGRSASSSRSVAEPLVDAHEDVLEDVLGVVLGQAEALDGDRVDVAREALDELAPGVVVARHGSARRVRRR